MHRLTRAVVAPLVLATALAGCGGNDDSGTPAPTAGATTTTTAVAANLDLPEPDPALTGLASAGVVQPADLGEPWTENQPADGILREVRPNSRLGCAFTAGGADPAAVGALADGPVLQRGTQSTYVTSSVLVFADEGVASAAVEAFRSEPFRACRTDALTAEARAKPGEAEEPRWIARPLEDENRGQGGFEGYLRFQFQASVDGEVVDANGLENIALYRRGAAVLVLSFQSVAGPGDPQGDADTTDDEVFKATVAALDRLTA